jgi:DNA-binding MarR family transcriptional regulator
VNHEQKLVQQAAIVSTMMLAVARAMHGDYRRKHVGAVWEELLTAFVLWQADTVTDPMSVAEIAKVLGIPRSNVKRALDALIDDNHGLARKTGQRYCRNVDFVSVRPNSRHFTDIRVSVIRAGRELERVFG